MNFKDTVLMNIVLPMWHSILVRGIHGKGKTEAIRLAAKMLSAGYHDERLSQCDVGDLKGMPFFINGRTVFAMPEWFPIQQKDADELKTLLNLEDISMGIPNDVGFLALEELDRATRQVQQAAFQLVLDRELNGRKIRPGWRVVACINADDDIYQVLDMDPALLDRLVNLEFRPMDTEWLDYARGIDPFKDYDFSKVTHEFLLSLEDNRNKHHPAVIEFITRTPKMLDPTKELILENPGKKLHSRRSWTRFSEALYVTKAWKDEGLIDFDLLDKSDSNLDMLMQVASGYVGDIAAAQFQSFIRTDYKSLDANVILNKWDTTVRDRLLVLVKKNQILELSKYNNVLVAYIQEEDKPLTQDQRDNLCNYAETMPAEVVADFWKNFNSTSVEISTDWYRTSQRAKKILLSAMADPSVQKK